MILDDTKISKLHSGYSNIHKNQNQIPAVLRMGGQVCQLLSGEPEKHHC